MITNGGVIMDQAYIAQIINKLVDMLLDEGVDKDTILEELDLSAYETAYCGLGWLAKCREE